MFASDPIVTICALAAIIILIPVLLVVARLIKETAIAVLVGAASTAMSALGVFVVGALILIFCVFVQTLVNANDETDHKGPHKHGYTSKSK